MADLDVRIVQMGARRLAYVQEFGTVTGEPEKVAWSKLGRWVRAKGLTVGPSGYHYFGANDPPPTKDGDRYGYFSGVTVPQGVNPEGDVKVKVLPASTYAVVRFKGIDSIGSMWQALYNWVEKSGEWSIAGHGLEELLTPVDTDDVGKYPKTMVFDLWLPICKRDAPKCSSCNSVM